MAKNYAVRLRCPYGDTETWVVLENQTETLEEILRTAWDFECEAHGVQREFPLEATEKAPGLAPTAPAAKPAEPRAPKRKPRGTDRQPLRVPLVVYGWSEGQGAFHEDTATIVVNSSGARISLTTKVEVGETIFLVNKITNEEQEARVAHVDPEFSGGRCVGVAFKQPAPDFWRKTRQNPRLRKKMRVIVRGVDPNGNPFVHSANTVDVSQVGARLDGVGYLTKPGDTIEVKRRWHGKARYRVVWIGQIGSAEVNQIGLSCLDADKNIWSVSLPESDEPVPAKVPSPPKKQRSP